MYISCISLRMKYYYDDDQCTLYKYSFQYNVNKNKKNTH